MEGQQQHTEQATFTIPILIPPELAALTKDLISLTDDLKSEIEFYRTTREPLAYSEQQLADFFGISLKSMRRERTEGRISYTCVAGKFWYSRKQIEDYIERTQTRRAGK